MERIRLDIVPKGIVPICHATQYDKGRVIRCELMDGLQGYTLSNETITVNVRKPDGHIVTADLEVVSGNNYVDVVTTEQMCAVAGENACVLKITKGSTEIGTIDFKMQVKADVTDGGIQSDDELNNLEHQVHDIVVEELRDNGAEETGYDNTESGLDATNVQDALDELAQKPSVDAYTKQESDAFITDEYDAESTYAIGDMVIHENALYVCSTAITTAEAWNSAHWTLTDIATAIGTVKTAIPTKTSDLQNDSGFAQIDDSEESASKTYSSEKIEAVVDGVQSEVSELTSLTTEEVPDSWENVPLTCREGYYYSVTGVWVDEVGRKSAKLNVNVGETYKVSTYLRSVAISGIMYFNANDEFIGKDLNGTGTNVTITDYEFTIPENTSWIAVQSTNSNEPTLSKQTTTLAFKAYDKTESDSRYVQKTDSKLNLAYGVKWSMSDPDDLGTRCFDAIGKSATIGVGATNGSSDFDSIYPWSEIKRCNIKENSNGAPIVTFEGESGFALDGTNGDVFVRIPKFACERYIENGHEYRVITRNGNPHPAFIENGKELDEIFISAFEGYKDSNSKLRSIGGVIPSSNDVPQDYLDYAQANGTNYSLYDSRCVDLIFTLFAIEFGCRNTNHILGYGLADFEQAATYNAKDMITVGASNTNTVRTAKWTASQKTLLPVGANITVCDTTQQNILTQAKITACVDGTDYTDWTFDGDAITVTTNCFIGASAFSTNWCENCPSGALSWHTGRTNWIANDETRNAVRYRWIENIIGNLWHYLPDVTFDALQMYVCKDMKDYVMHKKTSPYLPQSAVFLENNDNGNKADVTGDNYWITSLEDNIFARGIPFARTYDKSLTSKKAFGGYYYLKNTLVTIANGGGFDHLYRCNILTQRAWIATTQKWYLYGARLMYKDIR